MRYTLAALLILITPAALGAQGSPEGAPSNPNLVAVLPLEIVGEVPAGRPALEAAVLRGLSVSTVPALQPEEAESRLRDSTVHPPCETGECWAAVGRSLQARYLLTGTVERKGPVFAVEFRLADARLGRVLATESNRCEVDDCSVAELCRLVVREIARQNLIQANDPPQALPATAAMPAVERPPAAPLGTASQVQSASTPPDQLTVIPSLRRWALPVIAGGVLAGAAGGLMLWINTSCAVRFTWGEPECMTRHHDNRLNVGGFAAIGVGAALVTTGVVLFVSGDRSAGPGAGNGVKMSLGPDGAWLSGRF